jgi:hypothetical protein
LATAVKGSARTASKDKQALILIIERVRFWFSEVLGLRPEATREAGSSTCISGARAPVLHQDHEPRPILSPANFRCLFR